MITVSKTEQTNTTVQLQKNKIKVDKKIHSNRKRMDLVREMRPRVGPIYQTTIAVCSTIKSHLFQSNGVPTENF